MNILYVHPSAELYGSDRSLLRLTSSMARDGHAITVVLPGKGPLVSKLTEAGVSVRLDVRVAYINRSTITGAGSLLRFFVFHLPRAVLSMARLLRKLKPDVVHTNSAVVLSVGPACRWMGIPHVWHVREHFHDQPRIWRYYRWFMVAFSSRILCVSAAIADQFPSRLRGGKVRVLHNGFPREEFPGASAEEIAAFRKKCGVPDRRLVVLVGRIKLKRKGQETFIAAAQRLHAGYPDVAFMLVGSPYRGNEEQLEILKKQVAEGGLKDAVIFAGEIHPAHVAFSSAEIVVMASGEPEPFGGVVIEAMAFGRPVVGTDIGGTPEQVQDGITGILVPPNDPEKMAGAIQRLLDDPAWGQKLGRAGRQRFMDEFEFDSFKQKMMSLYGTWASPVR